MVAFTLEASIPQVEAVFCVPGAYTKAAFASMPTMNAARMYIPNFL